MSDKISKDTYYKLTDEDKKYITEYFNERNIDGLIEFCSEVARVASYTGLRNAEMYLKDVGIEKFFQDCRSCGNTFDCAPEFALSECGGRYEEWIPLTVHQEEHLKELRG